jgi:DNA repair photolyase
MVPSRDRQHKGRGAGSNPPNRFERFHAEPFEVDVPYDEDRPPVRTTFFDDRSRSILSRNDSPDIPFTYSVNPYRGCEHGCIYCYARPSHEYLGFSAGLDFESKIMVKRRAPELLRRQLTAGAWVPQAVELCGNTDCYQPVERVLKLTRGCLEVFLDLRNPVYIITKNQLVLRDLDLLTRLAALHLVHVTLSVTTLDESLARVMEPRTSSPRMRMETIRSLAEAGVPASVSVAPVIPGLTDAEIPGILREAVAHGACSASYSVLRLPGAVEQLFVDWVQETLPERAQKILSRIRSTRNGSLSDSRFVTRMQGEGTMADMIQDLFLLHVRRLGLDTPRSPLETGLFVRKTAAQLGLFDEDGPR